MRSKFQQILLLGLAALMGGSLSVSAHADTPDALIAQGDQQWAVGKLDLAQQAFEQAITAEPGSVQAYMKLGGLQLSRQNFSAGIQTYQRAIGLDAHNAKAWLGLAFSYLHAGKNDLSLAAFQEAVRIDPANREKLAPVMAKLATP